MALNKAALAQAFKVILTNPDTTSNAQEVAEALAEAIDGFVKSGEVTGVTSNGGTLTQTQIL